MDVSGVFPETVAWGDDGAGDGATTVVPEIAEPDPDLAWSAADDDGPAREPWRTAVGAATFLLVAGVVIAVLVVWAYRDWEASRRPVTQAVTTPALASPSPATKAAVPGAPTVAALPTEAFDTKKPLAQIVDEQDAVFISTLQRSPGLTITNRESVIAGGRSTCVALDQGHSFDELVGLLLRSNSSLLGVNARDMVHAAEVAYCPWRLGE